MKIAILGAGWAGMAAAVRATELGAAVTLFEASRSLGGRARAVDATLPDGSPVLLDNGQHLLIGAYSETLGLMRQVGVDPELALLRLPLTLKFPDGHGLQLPTWPAPWNALAGIASAKGWGLRDKASLVRAALGWQMRSFQCPTSATVAELCRKISARVMQELIEPLCVSALNTPTDRASGQVFLRVMQDSLFGVAGSSDLLLPRVDLSALFPQTAAHWLHARGARVKVRVRVESLQALNREHGWQLEGEAFDQVIVATSASNVASALTELATSHAYVQNWLQLSQALQYEAITTVYAWAAGAQLSAPMLSLRSHALQNAPAQFVFDRAQLGGPPGLLAFVVSASSDDRATLQAQVIQQAKDQLGLNLQAVLTVVEKRATFACTPGLQRPPMDIAPGLLACGDYVDGPYPATLEGAVRSGIQAANQATHQSAKASKLHNSPRSATVT